MTTYTTWLDNTASTAQSGGNYAGTPKRTVLVGVYDAKKRPLASTNVIELITIPAGTFVEAVFYRVLTADAGVGIDVGDGTDPNGWIADADVGTAGNIGMGLGAYAVATPGSQTATIGKYYSAADTIDLYCVSGDAYDTLKVQISVACTIA
jgi:hypothetical protein